MFSELVSFASTLVHSKHAFSILFIPFFRRGTLAAPLEIGFLNVVIERMKTFAVCHRCWALLKRKGLVVTTHRI